METQLRRDADSQRAAEALRAQRAEERMQSAVDAAVQSAVERARSESQDEMEAERQWWRVEVERVRREVGEAVRGEGGLRRVEAAERIRAGIRETERGLALLEMDSETEVKQE
jgi:hypothetical protein